MERWPVNSNQPGSCRVDQDLRIADLGKRRTHHVFSYRVTDSVMVGTSRPTDTTAVSRDQAGIAL